MKNRILNTFTLLVVVVIALAFAPDVNAQWVTGSSSNKLTLDAPYEFVGIGINNPLGRVHIKGATSKIQLAIDHPDNDNPDFSFFSGGKTKGQVKYKVADGGMGFYANKDNTTSSGLNNSNLGLWVSGTVDASLPGRACAIGTQDIPAGYLFAVNGKIIAEGLEVRLKGNWPDFVFADDYNLKSLAEKEAFIKANSHLEGVPSAATMEANGLDVAEMDAVLLQQVEELWLHMIDLKKENDALKLQIEELSK